MRERDRKTERKEVEISFKDAAYGNVEQRGGGEGKATSGSVDIGDDSNGDYAGEKIDQVAVICHARTRILKDCTVGTKARSVFFDDIKGHSLSFLSPNPHRRIVVGGGDEGNQTQTSTSLLTPPPPISPPCVILNSGSSRGRRKNRRR